MSPVIRRADLDDDAEAAAILAADERHFSITYDPAERDALRDAMRDLRAFVADDGGAIVGVAGYWPFSVTLPGPVRVPAAGVIWVAVAATHRRRGLLRRWLGEVHADADVCRAAYDRYARLTPGEVDRLDGYWTMFRANVRRFVLVVAEEAGEVTGFARYSVASAWNQGNPCSTLTIEDLVAVTDDARTALWRLACSVDLVTALETYRMPLDDPFPWTLGNSRLAMTTHLAGHLWCATLDAAFAVHPAPFLATAF